MTCKGKCKVKCKVVAPDYVEQDGEVYEKVDSDTVLITTDLKSPDIDKLKEQAKQEGFVSWQEMIRDAIRGIIKCERTSS